MPGAATKVDLSEGRWAIFCERWNETLSRRPTASVVFFSGACTLTWAMTFAALSCTPAARFALGVPEIAVGWLVMRTTARLRMPLNFAVAAPVSRLFPALSRLKISPLLAVFAADADTKKRMEHARDQFAESLPSARLRQMVRNSFQASEKFLRWAEGPIDKYGLSYFLTSKVSNVSTLVGATLAARHGLDVPGMLSGWGFSGDLQSDSGLLACTAALNVGFTPLHFYGAVAAVSALERFGGRLWRDRQRELAEKQAQQLELTEVEKEHLEMSESHMAAAVVGSVAFLTLFLDLAFAIYIMRKLYGSQKKKGDVAESSDSVATESSSE